MAETRDQILTAGVPDFDAGDVGTTNPNYAWNVYGTSGANLVTMNANGGVVNGYAGDDLITVKGAATAYGGSGDDTITVTAGANTVYGDDGVDTININSAGATTAYGGAGVDTISLIGTGASTVYGGDGADVIRVLGTATGSVIYGDAGIDSICMAAAANGNHILYGGADNDLITVDGTGTKVVYGDAGDDTITVHTGATGAHTLAGGAGADAIGINAASVAVDTIIYNSTDGIDTITGLDLASGEDVVKFDVTADALAQASYSFAAGVSSTISLSSGNALVIADGVGTSAGFEANATNTQFVTSDGKKVVYAAGATQTNDTAADTYVVGLDAAGNTLKYIAAGVKYYGKAGVDTVDATALSNATAVTIDLSDTTKYSSIEKAVGGGQGDVLRGLAAADTLSGAGGADQLWGRAGNDSLSGGAGDDTFYVGIGDGADTIADATGAAGTDLVKLYNVAKNQITVSQTAGDTKLTFTGGDSVTLTGFEAVAYTTAGKFSLSDGSFMKIGAQTAGNIKYDSTVGYYLGSNAAVTTYGVTAAAETAAVTMNLYDTTKFSSNINTAIGSATVANTLRGRHNANDVLTGGAAADALWGGTAGNDTMNLGAADGVVDTVYFGKTDGIDTVNQQSTADKVKLWNVALSDIAGFATVGGNLELTFANNSADKLIMTGGTAPTFELQDGSTFTVSTSGVYASTASFYATAALVDASAQTSAVTLDLRDTVKYESTYLNATGGSGADVLRGNASANALIGGIGNDLIWGAGGADVLTGGAGTDTFYWGTADGSDRIADGQSGESVLLYSSGMATSNVTAAMVGADLVLTSFGSTTLQIDGWDPATLNKFVFGTSATSTNQYRLKADLTWEQITA